MVFRARGTSGPHHRQKQKAILHASTDTGEPRLGNATAREVLLLTIYRDTSGSVRSSNEQELPGEVIWIDLLNPTDDEKAFVEARAHVRIPSMEALSEIESSSRLIVEG
jgi:Mg2+ and Co2+ transporter CorA